MKNNSLGFLIIVTLLIASAFFSLNLYLRQRSAHDQVDVNSFPYQVGQWQGRDLGVEEEEYQILETRNLVLREYRKNGKKISLFIVYSETNRLVFHPPEVCMMGSGVKIVDKKIESIEHGSKKFSVNKLYVAKDGNRGLALYCYKAGNLYTDNFYLQQISFAFNQLLGRHKAGATIRASAPLGNDEKEVLEDLKDFFIKAVEHLETIS